MIGIDASERTTHLPVVGLPWSAIEGKLDELAVGDAQWRRGRTGSLVYCASEEVTQVGAQAYTKFYSENALGVRAFPSLQRMEEDLVAITADLLGADEHYGNVTSGGTESILLAVKVARDHTSTKRRARGVPEILMPATAHPAFNKAAHYLGMRAVRVAVDRDFRVDPAKMRAKLSPDTVLMVGSAPSFTHGVIDPIEELAQLALEHQVALHVDACVGGFFLPFLRRLGNRVPPFDFAVDGVTSMSADLHKYGYTGKGASVILHRTKTAHLDQIYRFGDWPVGHYETPTFMGTRPGGAIAAAWAVTQYLGEQGYLRLVGDVMDVTRDYQAGIAGIDGLRVWGKPVMSVFGFGSKTLDIMVVADEMERRNWYINRQAVPPGIHLVLTPTHRSALQDYLQDLAEAVKIAEHSVRADTRAEGSYA